MKRLVLPCLFTVACVLLGLALRDARALADGTPGSASVPAAGIVQDAAPGEFGAIAPDGAPAVIVTVPSGTSATVQTPAAAVPPSTVSVPPTPDDVGFLGYLMSGKYLLAVGAALVGIVAVIRVPLAKYVPWFGTKVGGYVLGFGSAALLYFGTALTQSAPITPALLSAALVAGFAASGKWEALQDVLASLRRPPDPAPSGGLSDRLVPRAVDNRPTAVSPPICASCGQPKTGGAA